MTLPNDAAFGRRESDPLLAAFQERLLTLHTDIVEVKSAIKEVASALTKLALVEERQTHHTNSMERAFKALERLECRIAEQEKRIIELEKSEPMQHRTSEWVERALWAAAATSVMFVATKVGLIK